MANQGIRSIPGKRRQDDGRQLQVLQGRLADRPPAQVYGRVYVATDTSNLAFVDNGYSWLQIPAPRLLAHSETDATQASSTAEFDLINTTVPAGTMLVGDALRLHGRFMVFNSTGVAITVRWRMYIAGTLIADSGASDSIATGARWRWWRLESLISLLTLTQIWHRSDISGIIANPSAETDWVDNNLFGAHRSSGIETTNVAGMNWANATAIRVTGQLSSNAANAIIRTNGFTLERLIA